MSSQPPRPDDENVNPPPPTDAAPPAAPVAAAPPKYITPSRRAVIIMVLVALAGIALMLGTVVLFKMKRDRYAWVTAVPAVWLLICTTYAGLIKIFDSNPAQGFLAQAHKFQDAIASGTITAPAKSMAQMQQIVVNAYVNTGLTVLFLFVVFSILAYALKTIVVARRSPQRTDKETAYVKLEPHQMADL